MAPIVWVVNAPTSIAPLVEDKSVVAIGWRQVGDLSECSDREAVKKKYRETYPDDSEPTVGAVAGMLHRFMHIVNPDDIVPTPIKTTRIGRHSAHITTVL